MILLIKIFHLEMALTSTINFQVRDLDLQAMGGGGDSTEKNLWPHTYHQTIYESDLSKGLEIMRCSNKEPKSVTHDVIRGKGQLLS